MQTDKVIITNMGALKEKYGKRMPRIESALLRLVHLPSPAKPDADTHLPVRLGLSPAGRD